MVMPWELSEREFNVDFTRTNPMLGYLEYTVHQPLCPLSALSERRAVAVLLVAGVKYRIMRAISCRADASHLATRTFMFASRWLLARGRISNRLCFDRDRRDRSRDHWFLRRDRRDRLKGVIMNNSLQPVPTVPTQKPMVPRAVPTVPINRQQF